MSGSLNEQITKTLAYAFFSSATPFRFVENAAFKECFALLRPSYKLPSRQMLSGTLLNEAYDELHTKMLRQIAAARHVAVVTDSWTDINGCPVMNYIVLTPEPFFYKSIYTGQNSHTASYIADQLSIVIDALGPSKVCAVVTDNAAPNHRAWEILMEKYREQRIMCYGCSAHWLNLVIQDIMKLPPFATLKEKYVEIIRFFKNKHLPKAELEAAQIKEYKKVIALRVPVETRWLSNFKSLDSLIKTKAALKMVCVTSDEKNSFSGAKGQSIKRSILQDYFWESVFRLHVILQTISVAIADVEKDASSASSIFPAFTSIINNLTCLDVENSGDTVLAIKDRWTDLLSPLIAISFLLDPKMMLRHHYDEEVRALALRFLQDNYDNEEVIELRRPSTAICTRITDLKQSTSAHQT